MCRAFRGFCKGWLSSVQVFRRFCTGFAVELFEMLGGSVRVL